MVDPSVTARVDAGHRRRSPGLRRRPARRWCAAVGLLAALAMLAPAAEAVVSEMRVEEPRDFGWFIGDRFTRRVEIQVGEGFAFDEEALPAVGEVNHWLERTAVQVTRQGSWVTVELTYRITNAPEGPGGTRRTVPGWNLMTEKGARRVPTNVPEWSFTQLPVVPAEDAEFLSPADVQPDRPPPQAPWSAHLVRVTMLGLAVTVLALYLFYCHYGAVWVARWRRPFTAALRDLRRTAAPAGGAPASEQIRQQTLAAALSRFHAAVNEAAGGVVLHDDLDDFLRREPLYASERDAIARVFEASDALFFDPAAGRDEARGGQSSTLDPQELVGICRRLSVLELSTP